MTETPTILIVDDEPVAAKILAKALENLGVIRVAASGAEALARARAEPIDIVLLDVCMREMDGFETCRALLGEHVDLPVIFLTASSDPATEIRALEAGGLDFIGKPVNPPVVRARVGLHLKLKAQSKARSRLELDLRRAKGRLEAMLNALPDPMLLVDREGVILEYHAPPLDELHVEPEAFLGKRIVDSFPADAAAILMAALDRAACDGSHRGSIYSLALRKGLSFFEISVAAMAERSGSYDQFVVLARDITGRKTYERELERARDDLSSVNRALKAANAELKRLARTDTLTGAWNRRRLEESVSDEMERLKRYGHPLSLAVVDIDFFKKINDVYGHAVGDRVLARLAALMRESLRPTDSLTRWGGEEFIVVSPNEPLASATILAERLRADIGEAQLPEVGRVTVSIGVAECLPSETWAQWFARADAALYRAKAEGRNRVRAAPETAQRGDSVEPASASFVQLSWRPAYECGHPVIDRQHRDLFDGANRLLAAVLSDRPAEEIAAHVDALIGDVGRHFSDEEAIVAAAGYVDAAEHAALHRRLLDQARSLAAKLQAGVLGIGDVFQFLAYDVVALHMLRSDREFFPFLRDRHLQGQP